MLKHLAFGALPDLEHSNKKFKQGQIISFQSFQPLLTVFISMYLTDENFGKTWQGRATLIKASLSNLLECISGKIHPALCQKFHNPLK